MYIASQLKIQKKFCIHLYLKGEEMACFQPLRNQIWNTN